MPNIINSISLVVRSKFGKDISWNLVSFVILGISGIVLNIIIGRFYGASTLGVFNQVYALYIFFAQLAVFGIHFSVLKHVAEFSENQHKRNAIITSAIIITALFAGLICLLVFVASNCLGKIFESPAVSKGIVYILPGLWCFALNKVLMAVLNGLRQMKAFAVLQAMRYILMITILVGCVFLQMPGIVLPIIFSGAEIVLLCFLLFYTLRFYTPVGVEKWMGWVRRHIQFGTKGFLSGTMSELNTRVDVLMLGYFVSDKLVGIYSMAAFIVEGFIQISVVFRNNLNPLLTQFIVQNKTDELKKSIAQGVKLFYLVMGVLGITAIFTYPFLVKFLVSDSDFTKSWIPFIILMSGLMLCAGYLPLNMILVQTGYPGLHTLLISAITLSNIILNILLIPLIGMYGAAYATAISFILSALFLKLLVRKILSIRI